MILKIVAVFNLLVLCFSTVSLSQVESDSVQSDISLRTIIAEGEVPLNREVVYHVELRWQGDLSKYSINNIVDPGVSNLEIRGKGSSNKVTTDAQGRTYSIKRVTYYFTPLELGMAYVDGVTVKYEDTILQQNESLISGRIGVKIIDAIPEPVELNYMTLLLYALGLILLIGLIIFFILRYRKRKVEEQARLAALPRETVEEKYLRLLRETIQFSNENVRECISDMLALISGYFAEKYHLPPGNLPADDLLGILKEKELDESSLSRLKEFLRQANLVKFAGEKITETDFHQNFDTIELILQHQKNVDSEGEGK
jgi:hypothetical protein